MGYIFTTLLGLAGGAFCMFIALETKRRRLHEQERRQNAQAADLQKSSVAISARQQELDQYAARLTAERDQYAAQLNAERAEFNARVVSYDELQDENAILKRDLRNMDAHVRKIQLDRELQRQAHETLDRKCEELGSRYLKENVKWIGSSLSPNNFAICKQRLKDVIERCRGIGFPVSVDEEAALLASLREEYEKVVRAAFEREEQARIKVQIREEQMREREIERELKQLEREREAIKAALERALADAKDQHSSEVQFLLARLAEAEEKSQRAIAQAQLTKAGHVYVISNIGSFGEGVFKVGMTRRLEPQDRIRELGDASVPFPFDVHMMISSQDAPSLENAIHRKLHKLRINKTNPRKEFFVTDVESICQIVREHHGEVEYVADAAALEYRQSLAMPDEDQEFIENVYDRLEEDSEAVLDDL
ncbi:MAG: GIY-YIG nuclease family protein [Pirellulales bacterium]